MMHMENIHGVIFDLDGTLVESAPLYREALVIALQNCQICLDTPQLENLLSSMNLVEDLKLLSVEDEIAQHIAQLRDELVYAIFSERVDWIEGAENIVNTTKARIPIGLVTSAWTKTVDAVHRRLGIKNIFKVIIDGNSVHGRYKPDPYGLQLAAQLLDLPPKNLLYVGDSETDVVAASAAGIRSCLLNRNAHTDSFKLSADYCAHSWQEFGKLLEAAE